jgi:outer membrane lipoprotein carrier protein
MRCLRLFIACFAVLMLMLVPFASHAQGATKVGPGRSALQQFSAKVQTLSGQFTQKVLDANNRVLDQSEGTIKLQAPRQFRWEIKKPAPQLVLADGDNIWVYDVELEQVSVRPQSFDESNSPLAVLLDLAMLDSEFQVSEAGIADGMQWLSLKSKAKEPEFASARLGFNRSGLALMELRDNFGQRTEIRFARWQKNPKLSAAEFQFTPPAGVDVVGETAGKAQITPIPD